VVSGLLKSQRTSPDEVRRLLELVDRDLEQADVEGLYADGRYTFTYNAALQLANLVLRLKNLRVGSPGRHEATFREVERFVPASFIPLLEQFEHARRKRNVLMYDRAGAVSVEEVKDLKEATIAFAVWVRAQANEYLKAER
jgi:hypothetical protein